MNKIFVVGCPRSGTTLLQSLLASHSKIISFPETHLLSETVSINRLVQLLTVYRTPHYKKLNSILSAFGVTDGIQKSLQKPILNTREWVSLLLKQLDKIGFKNQSSDEPYLLEKTPRHLHYIDLIQSVDPSAKIIHIVRNGEDVVASMTEATGENPDEWNGRRSVDKSVFWWNRSIRISEKYIGRSNNIHIRYENLISQNEAVLNYICSELGLSFESAILKEYHKTAEKIINEEESWKSKNTETEIISSNKFSNLPTEIQQEIKKGLRSFDYALIDIANLKKR